MDIQEAEKAFARLEKIIGKLEPNDIEKAIKEFQEFIENGYGCSKLPSSWSIRLALAALQEQAKRNKGCPYCDPKNVDYYYAGNVPNYCKHCGRKLK